MHKAIQFALFVMQNNRDVGICHDEKVRKSAKKTDEIYRFTKNIRVFWAKCK